MSILQLGRDSTVYALGRKWIVSRLVFGILDDFVSWVREEEGDPFAGLEKIVPLLPPVEGVAMVKEAAAKRDALKGMDFTSPLVQKYQQTARGLVRLFWLALKVKQPDVTLDDAFDIAAELGMVKLQKALEDGAGEMPAGPPAGAADARATSIGNTASVA